MSAISCSDFPTEWSEWIPSGCFFIHTRIDTHTHSHKMSFEAAFLTFDSIVMSTLSPKLNYAVHKGVDRAAFRGARGKMMKKLSCGGLAASLLSDCLRAHHPRALTMLNCLLCLCVPAYMCVPACCVPVCVLVCVCLSSKPPVSF